MDKRILAIIAVLFALCANSFGAGAPYMLIFTNRNAIWVDPNGYDSGPGTVDRPFRSITNAVAHMGVSNLLNIMPGTYNIDSNHISPPMGYVIDGHGATIISDPDDGAPKLRLRDNCVAFNLILQCSSNTFNQSLFWGGVGNWNQAGFHSDFPATNFYVHHLRIHNALSDVFYIGNSDLTNRYQGVIENCEGDGFFDGISVGGTNNSQFLFKDCTFTMNMDPANLASTMIRSTGGNIICQNVNYTITNVTAINAMWPFVFNQDGSTKIVIDGGKWVFWNFTNQFPIASGYSVPLGSGYMTGRFLYSTNGGAEYIELTPGITNKWLRYPLTSILSLGFKTTNSVGPCLLTLNFQLNASAGSGTIGMILHTVSGTVTNQFFTSGYNNSAVGDVTALNFNGIPLNPGDFWWYDVDPNTTSTTLFGNVTLDAAASIWEARYWRQSANPPSP